MLALSRQLPVYTWVFSLFIFIFSSYVKAERPESGNLRRSPSSQNSQSKQNTTAEIPKANEDHSQQKKQIPPSRPIVPNDSRNTTSRSPSVLSSTLSGTIVQLKGNQMPTRGINKSAATQTPLMTNVYIYQGKIEGKGDPSITLSSLTQKVFAIVKSDNRGRFRVELPPGEYTIFGEIDGPGKLYRNSFDGMGNFSTITVKDRENIVEDIKDIREAVF